MIGLLAPSVADKVDAPRLDKIFVAELNLDRLCSPTGGAEHGPDADAVRIQTLPRYPFVVRDLSIVIAETLPAEIIRGTIQRAGGIGLAPLVASTFFDRYEGKGLPEGTVSLSVRLTFQSPDRTLTDADVQDSVEHIRSALASEHSAVQR